MLSKDFNIVTRILFGSHLYGTSTPSSDYDYKSVYLPSSKDILLQRVKDSIHTQSRAKAEGEKNQPGDVDEESFSLQRYLDLLMAGQTVAIDMLFAPKENQLHSMLLWNIIFENRFKFLTNKSAAFVGYCRTQANKYGIKGSRVAAAEQAVKHFYKAIEDYGHTAKVGSINHAPVLNNEHTYIESVVNRALPEQMFFVCCNRKVDYNATVKQAFEIFDRIYANYGDRARLAQSNEGIDWKALSHAVRVGKEAIELLGTGIVTFPRPEASYLLQVKQGLIPYNDVAEVIEKLLEDVQKAENTSILATNPDYAFAENLVEAHYYGQVIHEGIMAGTLCLGKQS